MDFAQTDSDAALLEDAVAESLERLHHALIEPIEMAMLLTAADGQLGHHLAGLSTPAVPLDLRLEASVGGLSSVD